MAMGNHTPQLPSSTAWVFYDSFTPMPQTTETSSSLDEKKSNVFFGVAPGVVAIICLHAAFGSLLATARNLCSVRPSFGPALFPRISPDLVELPYDRIL